MKDKVVIITGAARGLGQKYVIEFAKLGAIVAFADINSCNETEDLVKEITSDYIKAELDVTDYNSCLKLAEEVKNEFKKIDVLINNAALYGALKSSRFEDIDEKQWDRAMSVNVKGVWNCIKAVVPTMREQKSGSIINISSVVGVKGNAGQSNYAASKSGIIGFSKSIALELGSRNIRCNVIAPGFIQTEMTSKLPEEVIKKWETAIPLKRGGTPLDIGNSCVFLASDLSSYITGQVLHVDGGMLT